MAGWGEAIATMRLRVDPSQVQRDAEQGLDKVDYDKAGRKGGTQFGQAFAGEAPKQLRNSRGQFVKEGGDAGDASGKAYASAFGKQIDTITSRLQSLWTGGGAKDKSGLGGVAAELSGFGAAADAASSKGSVFSRVLAGINLATGVLEPALAGLTVVAGGLTTAFGAVGLGAAGVGLVIKNANTILKEMDKLNKQAAAGNKKAAEQLKLMEKDLSPAMKEYWGALEDAKGAYQDFGNAMAKPVLEPVSKALRLVGPLLQDLKPFTEAAGRAMGTLVDQLSKGVASGGFKDWLAKMLPTVEPVLVNLGRAIGHVVVGIGGIMAAFAPVAVQITGGIERMTAKFAEWGQTLSSHSGFQALMEMFRTQTPMALEVLKNLATVIGNVVKAMAGLTVFSNSSLFLQLLTPLSEILAKLSGNRVLMDTALYILAIGSAVAKVAGPVKALGAALQFASANPIVLVAAAVVALGIAMYEAWQKSAGFRDGIKAIGTGFLAAGVIIVQANKMIVDAVLSTIGTILHGMVDAFGWVPGLGNALRGASASFDGFKARTDAVFDGMIGKMKGWQDSLNSAVSTANAAAGQITAAFARQQQAANTAKGAVDLYTTAIQNNGAGSTQAQAARTTLITDMTRAGVTAVTAQADVAAYTAAVTQNGVNSAAAGAARAKLISDILAASSGARGGRTDLDNYSAAVAAVGTKAAGAQAARAKLITDLVASGVDSRTAAGLVDGLGNAIVKLPGSKKMELILRGDGSYYVNAQGQTPTQKTSGLARGGKVRGPGGPRSDLAGLFALSDKEFVIQASSAEQYGAAAMAAINAGQAVVSWGQGAKGFAAGGSPSSLSLGTATPGKVNNWYEQTQTALIKALVEVMKKELVQGGAGSAAIVADAMSWLGKVPYVWGGTAVPGGADCSGFVQTIYGRHGISAPRTSEAQGAWVRRTGPVPGGLALYHSPAGGPDPGHVAIVRDKSQVISQGGGMGPQLQGIGSPLWTGIPPNGFARGGRIDEPVRGIGRYSRALYSFGEYGREWVVPDGDLRGQGGADGAAQIAVLLRQLVDIGRASPSSTGRHVGAAIDAGAVAAAFRARYPAGGS